MSGRIAAGAASDAVVGCIDIYPTLCELAGVTMPPEQTIDGQSYARTLLGGGAFERDAYFIWFPHLVPGVSVRRGDWKLIRRFEERPAEYAGTRELFNLRDDLGETTNLAEKHPERVRELDALIDRFLAETGALTPQPNPTYRAEAAPGAATRPAGIRPAPGRAADAADPLAGLVARSCETRVADGVLTVAGSGRSPFLGTAAVRGEGPLKLRLRIRSAAGGVGRVQWSTQDQSEFPREGPSVEFSLAAGETWQELSLDVPIAGTPKVVRLYLPAEAAPVELDAIRWLRPDGEHLLREWDFGGPAR